MFVDLCAMSWYGHLSLSYQVGLTVLTQKTIAFLTLYLRTLSTDSVSLQDILLAGIKPTWGRRSSCPQLLCRGPDTIIPFFIQTHCLYSGSLPFSQHVTGQPSTEYVSDETAMTAYANVHIALEQMRVRAMTKVRGSPLPPGEDTDPKLSEAPRILILGPENSGKSTVAKILTNYAVRAGQGWRPLLANVDPAEVSLGVLLVFGMEVI